MTRRLLAVISFALLLPTTCFAVLISWKGNQPIPAQNYTAWPGLVDVVNDESRVGHCWCNGDETMSYRGDTAALNRVVQEFAEVQAEERRIILLPGPIGLYIANSKTKRTGNDSEEDAADWKLDLVQGAVRHTKLGDGRASISDMDPTLTVYVTDRIDLKALRIPEGIKVVEFSVLRDRYASATNAETERVREQAQREINRLDAAVPKNGDAAVEFQSRLAAIQEFVRQRK